MWRLLVMKLSQSLFDPYVASQSLHTVAADGMQVSDLRTQVMKPAW